MKCAIMQPSYFPWSGYFNLISKSDKFVFLNDAQYLKASWHSRNIILVNNIKYTLTVPTKKSSLSTTILNKLVENSTNWQKKQAKIILQSYSNHPFIEDLQQLIGFFEELKFQNLSELNIEIIKFISKKLNLKTNFFYSNNFDLLEKRTTKIIQILNRINATVYLSPDGAKKYLNEDKFEELTDIKLLFNSYRAIEYKQKNQKNFIENLSIIDVIANLGWINTETYVKQKNINK
jgi:hypothetical protein